MNPAYAAVKREAEEDWGDDHRGLVARALRKRSGCRTAARIALLSADTGAIEKSSSAAVHAAVGGAPIIR